MSSFTNKHIYILFSLKFCLHKTNSKRTRTSAAAFFPPRELQNGGIAAALRLAVAPLRD